MTTFHKTPATRFSVLVEMTSHACDDPAFEPVLVHT